MDADIGEGGPPLGDLDTPLFSKSADNICDSLKPPMGVRVACPDKARHPGQNQVQKLLKSSPRAPSGTVRRHKRATTSGSMSGSKVDRTLAKSARFMVVAPRPPDRQNPRKTSSKGRPDLPTALRTRPTTLSASGLSKVVAAIPAEPSGATSNACVTSSKIAVSRSVFPTAEAKMSRISA